MRKIKVLAISLTLGLAVIASSVSRAQQVAAQPDNNSATADSCCSTSASCCTGGSCCTGNSCSTARR